MRKIKRNYTLIELLVVVAMVVVLMGSAYGFFYKMSKECRNASKKAMDTRTISLLKEQWRRYINECDFSRLKDAEDGAMTFGQERRVKLSDDKKVYLYKKGSWVLMPIPRGMTPSITVESNKNQLSYAVLNLQWRTRKGKKDTEQKTRIVACFKKPVTAAGKEAEK